jgi:hypothetical protein
VIQYRPKKRHDEYFSVPVLDLLVSISVGLVPEPALCQGADEADAAERSQETLTKTEFKYLHLNVNCDCTQNIKNFCIT